MAVKVFCDNCGKYIGNMKMKMDDPWSCKDDEKPNGTMSVEGNQVSRVGKKYPEGIITACSTNCALELDKKYGVEPSQRDLNNLFDAFEKENNPA